MKFKLILLIGICSAFVPLVLTQKIDDATIDIESKPYCFRFTWLGPKYDNTSSYQNATCDDLLKGSKGIPCTMPLVVTYNSNIPDTKFMWETYQATPSHVMCRLSRGDACVKYTYRYNNEVENITYFCTKVKFEDEGAAPLGCYMENRNGREVEVCVCESSAGGYPCNSASGILSNRKWIDLVVVSGGLLVYLWFQCNCRLKEVFY